MTKDEAISLITGGLKKVTGKNIEFDMETDLIESEILDSLDSMVFIFELETGSGVKFPETDLEEENFFQVRKLIDYLTK